MRGIARFEFGTLLRKRGSGVLIGVVVAIVVAARIVRRVGREEIRRGRLDNERLAGLVRSAEIASGG
jgi:hypothetical protein